MSEFARINRPRVEKINAILDQIEKSARSQRVSRAEIAELLAPVAKRHGINPPADQPAPAQPTPEPRGAKPPPVADPTFEAALEAIRTMPYGRVRQVSDAVPELLVAPVVTHLVRRLADRPLPQLTRHEGAS